MEVPHINHPYMHLCQFKSFKIIQSLRGSKLKIGRMKLLKTKPQKKKSWPVFNRRLIGFIKHKKLSQEGKQQLSVSKPEGSKLTESEQDS
jgi:hypothetical protein